MGILIDKNTRLVVQGITGRDGAFHTKGMLEYGTKVVAGVTPGKGGSTLHGVPVFNSMAVAVRETGANTSVIYVPPAFAIDAMYEAAESGVKLVICITEGLPAADMLKVARYFDVSGVRLVGPNCPGVITPGVTKVGIMPGAIHKRGPVGVVSRSGTLTYEVVHHLTQAKIGQSTCIGIGGDPIIGTRFLDVLEMFEKDRQTEAVALIGEIGGTDEEAAADYIQRQMTKPVVAFIAGRTAPPGKRMGHAGAIIAGGAGTAADKIAAFRAAGVEVADTPAELATLIGAELSKRSQRKRARVIAVRPAASMAASRRKATVGKAAKTKKAAAGKTAKARKTTKPAKAKKTTATRTTSKAKKVTVTKKKTTGTRKPATTRKTTKARKTVAAKKTTTKTKKSATAKKTTKTRKPAAARKATKVRKNTRAKPKPAAKKNTVRKSGAAGSKSKPNAGTKATTRKPARPKSSTRTKSKPKPKKKPARRR